MILGVLQSAYDSPRDGYSIYPLSIADLNALGKHLNEKKGQDDLLNRGILDIMDKISQLEGLGEDEDMEDVAVHSNNVRNNFFDSKKRLEDIIPNVLLSTDRVLEPEIPPRKRAKVMRGDASGEKIIEPGEVPKGKSNNETGKKPRRKSK